MVIFELLLVELCYHKFNIRNFSMFFFCYNRYLLILIISMFFFEHRGFSVILKDTPRKKNIAFKRVESTPYLYIALVC